MSSHFTLLALPALLLGACTHGPKHHHPDGDETGRETTTDTDPTTSHTDPHDSDPHDSDPHDSDPHDTGTHNTGTHDTDTGETLVDTGHDCGDGNIDADEECDDGNQITEDCDYGLEVCAVCAADCTLQHGDTQTCGDGVINGLEECDYGQRNRFTKLLEGAGPDEFFAATATHDGGFAMAGYSATFGTLATYPCGGNDIPGYAACHDATVLKYDDQGNEEWSVTLGTIDQFDIGDGLLQVADGGFVLTGVTDGWGALGYLEDLDMLVSRLDGDGNHLWTKVLSLGNNIGDKERAFAAAELPGSDLLIAGWTASTGNGAELVLARLDGSGNLVWMKTLGGSGDDFNAYTGPVLMIDDAGDVLLGGRTSSFGAIDDDLILTKMDTDGNHLWTRTVGYQSEGATGVVQTDDGGYLVSGTTWSGVDGEDYTKDIFLTRFDNAGNHLWSKTMGGADQDSAAQLVATATGFVLAGSSAMYAGERDLIVLGLDAAGDLLWGSSQAWGGPGYSDMSKALAQTTDGGFVVSGETMVPGMPQIPLLKLDRDGNGCSTTPVAPGELFVNVVLGSPSPTVADVVPVVTGVVPTVGTTAHVVTVTCEEGCFADACP